MELYEYVPIIHVIYAITIHREDNRCFCVTRRELFQSQTSSDYGKNESI